MRTKTEDANKNAHIAHKTVAVCAHPAHTSNTMTAATAKKPSAQKGYAGGKKRTNLSLDAELVDIAVKHFPATKHGSLSGFVEHELRRQFRALAPKLRKAGYKIPESVFTK